MAHVDVSESQDPRRTKANWELVSCNVIVSATVVRRGAERTKQAEENQNFIVLLGEFDQRDLGRKGTGAEWKHGWGEQWDPKFQTEGFRFRKGDFRDC